jgi:pimeloyl-ACP methyl ester carboxylesterase
MKTLRICAALIAFACSIASAHAGTRVYELGGLGCGFGLNPAAALAAKIPGTHVFGCYFNAGTLEADALNHRGDRIIVIGHSMGARTGAAMADDLARRGMNVKMIALDALYTGASASRAPTVHFWQGGYQMPGAHNVYVPSGYGHVAFPSDPVVQAKVLAAAGGHVAAVHRTAHAHHAPRHIVHRHHR